jgi:hypothetical protein
VCTPGKFTGGNEKMKRPKLQKVDLEETIKAMFEGETPDCFITMSRGQWDILLLNAYNRGWIILELDDNERPMAAYRKRGAP